LDENYAEEKNDADENASAAGWGREILAPAAGNVTYARNDVPNNPHPTALTSIRTRHYMTRLWRITEIASSSTMATPNTA